VRWVVVCFQHLDVCRGIKVPADFCSLRFTKWSLFNALDRLQQKISLFNNNNNNNNNNRVLWDSWLTSAIVLLIKRIFFFFTKPTDFESALFGHISPRAHTHTGTQALTHTHTHTHTNTHTHKSPQRGSRSGSFLAEHCWMGETQFKETTITLFSSASGLQSVHRTSWITLATACYWLELSPQGALSFQHIGSMVTDTS